MGGFLLVIRGSPKYSPYVSLVPQGQQEYHYRQLGSTMRTLPIQPARKLFGMITPFKKAQVSGMPLPAASFTRNITMEAEMRSKTMANPTARNHALHIQEGNPTTKPSPFSVPLKLSFSVKSTINAVRHRKSSAIDSLRRKLTIPHVNPMSALTTQRKGLDPVACLQSCLCSSASSYLFLLCFVVCGSRALNDSYPVS